MKWDVEDSLVLARMSNLLPLEVLVDLETLREDTPCSADRADDDFLVLERGLKASTRLYYANLGDDLLDGWLDDLPNGLSDNLLDGRLDGRLNNLRSSK